MQTDAYISQAFQVWAQRSTGPWTLGLEGLRAYVFGNEYQKIVRLAAVPPGAADDSNVEALLWSDVPL